MTVLWSSPLPVAGEVAAIAAGEGAPGYHSPSVYSGGKRPTVDMHQHPLVSHCRQHIDALVRAALEAADPARAVKRHLELQGNHLVIDGQRLSLQGRGRIRLVAFGKAATAMTRGACDVLGSVIADGLVVHPENEATLAIRPAQIKRLPGAHPLPNENSVAAGQALEALLADSTADDIVIVLISGGGSAMIELPVAQVSIERIAAITRALQQSGADIYELNCVRRTLSRIKGGGLLDLAAPARVIGLLLSDVVGDDPAAIASGPVVRSSAGSKEAFQVLQRYGLATANTELYKVLREPNTSGPPAIVTIVGSNALAAQAVKTAATSLGFAARVVTDRLHGDASEAGRMIATAAMRESSLQCLIFGGETTVTVRGSGRGGRNQELALSAACAIDGVEDVAIFSFATDGVDGASTAAGAIARGDTLKRAAELGVSAQDALLQNDSASFFERLGDAIVTGPTGTNVNDLAIALVYRT